MRKFIIGLIVILGLHIGFVAFFATLDTVESTRNNAPVNKPTAIPAANQSVRADEIVVARGNTLEDPADSPAVAKRPAPRPAAIAPVERRTAAINPRIAKTVKPQPKSVVPVYQTAGYTVERTEFPQNMTFAAGDDKGSAYTAKGKTIGRNGKRSFLAKVGSIIKKPYDGLKAVASWLH